MWNLFDEGAIDYVGTSTVIDDISNGPLAWQTRTLCAQTDPEAFFPEKGGSVRGARVACAQCKVREQYLEYVLANDKRFGIRGGLSEREHRRFKRRVS